jgi:hypothetical protein
MSKGARDRGQPDRQQGRKPLTAMTHAELAAWYTGHHEELADFCTYAQTYIKGRSRRGYRTATDERYERFLLKAADLLAGLEELSTTAAAQAAQDEKEEGEEGRE